MKNYKEIHLWDLPPKLTFVRLNAQFRHRFFADIIARIGSQQKLADLMSVSSSKYHATRIFPSAGNINCWIKGSKFSSGRMRSVNIPLWALIELSKIKSKSERKENKSMQEVERNIEYYTNHGKSHPITEPKLPLRLTPEMVSIIFHFMGDGHIGGKSQSSSYRQMNKEGLTNFLLKLRNIFGDFNYNRNEFENGKVIVPKIITDFYNHYFDLPNTDTFDSYIPPHLRSLSKEFLVASLVAFMIDEANIGEVIEVYSKNPDLIRDVRKIAVTCGYDCKNVRKKYRYGIFDCYRFLISSNSYLKLYDDITKLTKKFPLCGLVHKAKKFKILVKRKHRSTLKEAKGLTKKNIASLLTVRPRVTSELVELLNIGNSSIREHLYALEREMLVIRKGTVGRNVLWAKS